MPTISVVIPCLNEEKYVGRLLDDLAAQTKQPDEVIVADCRSDDKTVEIAQAYKNKLPLKIVLSKIRSPGAARNTGARTAGSNYLLFVDADIRLPSHFLNKIETSLKQKPVDYLTPAYHSDGSHYMDSLTVFFINLRMLFSMKILQRLWGMGGVMCVAKTVHRQIGGFDGDMQTQNDVDYLKKLRKYGASYTYLRSIKAITTGRRFDAEGISALVKLATRSGKPKNYGHYK